MGKKQSKPTYDVDELFDEYINTHFAKWGKPRHSCDELSAVHILNAYISDSFKLNTLMVIHKRMEELKKLKNQTSS